MIWRTAWATSSGSSSRTRASPRRSRRSTRTLSSGWSRRLPSGGRRPAVASPSTTLRSTWPRWGGWASGTCRAIPRHRWVRARRCGMLAPEPQRPGGARPGWLRDEAEVAVVEIALEALGTVQHIGEPDMAIWPHEVGRIAGEPCARRVAAPRKDVQRQSARRAPCSQAATGAAVHVHLPLQRLERREVVRRGLDPWQPIAAADAPGAPLAQAALPILDRRLGDGAKQEAPHRWQPEQGRDHARRHVHAHAGCEPPTPGDELEDTVSGRDQAARKADPLRLVAVEDARRRSSAYRRHQLPREVHCVADPGVHPLPANRAVDVRGIADEEDAPMAETRRDAVVYVVGREPVHAADVDAQPLQKALAHVVPAEILALLLRLGANGTDQPGAALFLEREDGGEIALVDRNVQLAVHQRPVRLHVSDVEEMLISAARKTDFEH